MRRQLIPLQAKWTAPCSRPHIDLAKIDQTRQCRLVVEARHTRMGSEQHDIDMLPARIEAGLNLLFL